MSPALAREMAAQLLALAGIPARGAPSLSLLLGALARPGLLIALSLHGERHLFSLGPGHWDAHSVFEVASQTKAFTAALVMQLAADGRIQLGTPLSQQFPLFAGLPPRVTPLALLSHSAGLPGQPLRSSLSLTGGFYDPYSLLSVPQLLDSARRWASALPPGFRYSNLGYGLLGLAVEQASGLALPDAVRLHLSLPLGLRDTGYSLGPEQRTRLVTPHLLGRPVPPTLFGSLTGAGGLFSSADNLLSWLETQLAARREGQLGAALLETQLEIRRLRGGGPVTGVAAGWLCARVEGQPWRWHGGVARGSRCALGFAPRSGVGLLVMVDSGPAAALAQPEALLFKLAQLYCQRSRPSSGSFSSSGRSSPSR